MVTGKHVPLQRPSKQKDKLNFRIMSMGLIVNLSQILHFLSVKENL